tara:strand:- start:2734 stop:3270 length:537 start_codon:yes stop_codon:yes gene_type:complete
LKKIFKKNHKKIGILGGTFDPPHIGHLHISKVALKKLKLNVVFWLITKQNPLKNKPYLSINTRIKLSEDILSGQKKIFVKYMDKNVKSRNTFNLLYHLKKTNKKRKLFFLMGTDNLTNFHKWKNWKKIPELAKIVIFSRPKYPLKNANALALKKLNKKDWIFINYKKMNISSSLIRKF